MLIKQEETLSHKNGKSCIVQEYPFENRSLGIAVTKITGRYPDTGKVINSKCDEMYYVVSGVGVIHTNKGKFEIKKGDTFLFNKGEWYWVETQNLEIIIPTSPAWYPEQYEEIK